MTESTIPAAAMCVACNQRAATAGQMTCAECRARMAAAAAANAAAEQAARDAEAASRVKPKTSARLVRDLEIVMALPALPPALVGTPDGANYAAAKAADAAARKRTCHQCGRVYGVEPDTDDAAIRCGDCVRANRAVLKSWRQGW